jgi:hypothetical protein
MFWDYEQFLLINKSNLIEINVARHEIVTLLIIELLVVTPC